MDDRRLRTQGRPLFISVILGMLLLLNTGFIPTRTIGGQPVSWGRGAVLTFRANTTNRSGLAESALLQLFTTSLNRWKQAAYDGFNFHYYQGSDPNTYPNYSGSVRDNSIFFTSNGKTAAEDLGCGTVAVTQVWFNQSTGVTFKADVRFNDKCFQFTNNPRDTSSQRQIYLADVATHEFGHAFGFDHDQNIQSSMVYTAAIQESKPSCVDNAAMMTQYAPQDKLAKTGTLNGSVVTSSNAAIFGAYVEAISIDRGSVVSAALTSVDGSFSITGLEPGKYSVMVSPFAPGPGSLGQFYSRISTAVCANGAAFTKTTPKSGTAIKTVTVAASGVESIGSIAVNCSILDEIQQTPLNNQTAEVSVGSISRGVFENSENVHYYLIKNATGMIASQALSYSLYSKADVSIEFINSAGQRLADQQSYDNSFSVASSGYTNYDSVASVQLGSTISDIYIKVQYLRSIETTKFPSGNLGVDSRPFYYLTVSNGLPNQNIVYPLNSRCENQDSFPQYAALGDPGTMPENVSGVKKSSGGCGMIYNPNDTEDFTQDSLYRLVNFAMILTFIFGVYINRKRIPTA